MYLNLGGRMLQVKIVKLKKKILLGKNDKHYFGNYIAYLDFNNGNFLI